VRQRSIQALRESHKVVGALFWCLILRRRERMVQRAWRFPMSRFVSMLVVCLGLFVLAPFGARAQGSLLPDRNAFGALSGLPQCTDITLGGHAMQRFNTVQSEHWGGRIAMELPARMWELGSRDRQEFLMARRWCEGNARFNDGQTRRFVIEISANTDGLNYGLAVCVEGLDRHMMFQPACRVLRNREF
jgi:hypothetical protein